MDYGDFDRADKYLNWMRNRVDEMYEPDYTIDEPKNDISINAGNTEMIRVTEDGFYVRGVRVPVDDKEALAVYNAFKEWVVWSQLTRT